ncbi:ankyrin repeat domain-containing protein [Nannocystis bainbridge]|uniref:Ankyrin repeat domain-containing protein n=1 Tax=Nannocystis bainbridge TaxID=2995303 RepID=A0ABT5E3E3_9BACT|nr:ankyrin repeat domain-containing protein [Nannocystis bainbridge]MDC0720270.1 ankyrin repeat domain-containing protein [Nannocystis bainbridge]
MHEANSNQLEKFRAAVAAIDGGEIDRLRSLLDGDPLLVAMRCRVGAGYEAGYFAGATLLHHVAGNPDRGPLAAEVVEIAQLLLDRGSAAWAAQATLELVLTSRRASEAGVAPALIDRLIAGGARLDLADPDLLSKPLLNLAPDTAEELVQRGARVDVRHAAALGRIDTLTDLLSPELGHEVLAEALAYACIREQHSSVALLLGCGAEGDRLVRPGGQPPRTPLHEAAWRGHAGVVGRLLAHGADPGVRDGRWGGTAADWAEHGGHPDLARRLRLAS